jgi:hypothetical protein
VGQSEAQDTTPQALAQRQLEAYNAQDVERFAACYADDVEAFELPAGTLLFRGRDVMRARYARLFAANPRLHCRLTGRIVEGDFVVDHEELSGRADGGSARAVAIYQVEAGRIRRVWFAR